MDFDKRGVIEGMHVYSSDGQRVGKVVRCGQSAFEIEKGFFFPKDYLINYSDVTRVSGDDIYLALDKDQLRQMWERTELVGDQSASTSTTQAPDQGRFAEKPSVSRGGDISQTGYTSSTAAAGETNLQGREGELRVPVAEEKLEVDKVSREAGEVRVRKEVHTETKTVNVPVTREEVKVERVPVSGERIAQPGEASFTEGTISVPVREEEVEIRKRPVVREEVRIRKEAHTENKQVAEEVRREEVEVEDETEEKRTGYPNEPGIHAGSNTMTNDTYRTGRDIDEDVGSGSVIAPKDPYNKM